MSSRLVWVWCVVLALAAVPACNDSGPPDIEPGRDGGPDPDSMVGPDADPAAAIDGAVADVIILDINTLPDFEGPAITIDFPAAGEILGGVIVVEALITDATEVDDSTVFFLIGEGDLGMPPVPPAPLPFERAMTEISVGRYRGVVLGSELRAALGDDDLVFPTLAVRAADTLGNQSIVGQENILDYRPPIVSLTSPKLREAEVGSDGSLDCSTEFQPLGEDAIVDRQRVDQLSEFRTRIEDRGNTAFSTSAVPLFTAGVDDLTVQLMVLDGATATDDALVVDTDGDGSCDAINPAVLPPVSSAARVIDLDGLAPAGTTEMMTTSFPSNPGCTGPPQPDVEASDQLCPSTGLQRIIALEVGTDPVIYTVPPASEFACMGLPVDLGGLSYGWACVAARADDRLGNAGVSRPIRVCINDPANPALCPGSTIYSGGPDVTSGIEPDPSDPVYILGTPPIDCLGIWTAGSVDSTTACTFPAGGVGFDFPINEVRRTDF